MIWVFILLLILPIASLLSPKAQAASTCEEIFQSQELKITTQIETSIRDLSLMKLHLDLAQVQGKNGIEMTALNAAYKTKEAEIFKSIELHHLMTRAEMIERMKSYIAEIQKKTEQEKISDLRDENEQRLRADRDQRIIVEQLALDGRQAIFRTVNPGKFMMGEPGKSIAVTITKSFELMAIPTTQVIWKAVAELAEKHDLTRGHVLEPAPSHNKGDTHPVDSVSFDDIQAWIKVLNKLSNKDLPEIYKLFPGHQKNATYRLPTEAEWEFVVRGRGEYNDLYHFGKELSVVQKYAWTHENSPTGSQPVATSYPVFVDNQAFFDMIGNVRHWVADTYRTKLKGGSDPLIKNRNEYRMVRGASYFYYNTMATSHSRAKALATRRIEDTGFRLVREPHFLAVP